jgi:hypothetical protein
MLATVPSAIADDAADATAAETRPSFSLIVPFELAIDSTFNSDDPDAELSDITLTIEPDLEIRAAPWLHFDLGLTFEAVDDPAPGEDRAFGDHGLHVRNAQAVANFGRVTVHAGKFAAPFAIAYEYSPGVYGDALNADLELAGRVGAGLAYNVLQDGADEGVILRAAAFARDTSFLSGSLLTNREKLHESDGGPGNTGTLNNFSLVLDVIEFEGLPGVHLRAAYVHQAAGDGDESDQDAFMIGANWQGESRDGFTYQVLAEWAHAEDAFGYDEAESVAGGAQDDLTVATAGVWDDTWTAAFGYSWREMEHPTGGTARSDTLQISGGYFFAENWLAEIAILRADNDGVTSHTAGFKLSYEFTAAAE